MKTKLSLLLLAGIKLASSDPSPNHGHCDNTVCHEDWAGPDWPVPNANHFILPTDQNRQQRCVPLYVGDSKAPSGYSSVCLDFVGENLLFHLGSFPGYATESATVSWQLANGTDSSSLVSRDAGSTLNCKVCAGGSFVCHLPYTEFLGLPSTTGTGHLASLLCPGPGNEGLGFHLAISGKAKCLRTGQTHDFRHHLPCLRRNRCGVCEEWDHNSPSIPIRYHCSNTATTGTTATFTTTGTFTTDTTVTVTVTTTNTITTGVTVTVTTTSTSEVPAPTQTCNAGTGFGYQSSSLSTPLNTLGGAGCNRWGWFQRPTLAQLQAGISGIIYVGAGGNNLNSATNVGTWTALASPTGQVTVTYILTASYRLYVVHVHLACTVTNCSPGQYTFNSGALPNVQFYATSPLTFPTCTGNASPYLIIHAGVSLLTTAATCPAPGPET
ncbi:hypothetical protein QBC34DRAFT_348223 [Podospora aff. communis PSN243]|uniref:Uncharacterized protein n=1 Tax=Podospora aff. communis PSN243 TaxID=3040156 RepID=A0AAV9GV09_9PEZI|nr:hypothetical protein QBC34DRAFT_348223 [Podospora aff. communis PSN243]